MSCLLALALTAEESLLGTISVLLAFAVLIALRLSFLLGRRQALRGRSPELDRGKSRLALDGTRWQIVYEEADPRGLVAQQLVALQMRQDGNRFSGIGQSATGSVWAIEGITDEHRLAAVLSERTGPKLRAGVCLVELASDGERFAGHRLVWSAETQTMSFQPITLRLDPE